MQSFRIETHHHGPDGACQGTRTQTLDGEYADALAAARGMQAESVAEWGYRSVDEWRAVSGDNALIQTGVWFLGPIPEKA